MKRLLKGKTQEGVDAPALSAHIDMYKTFCELTGAEIPESKLPPRGRSLLPLLEDPQASWEDRTLFSNIGRWKNDEDKKKVKYACGVRTQKWRLVRNEFLYDVNNDLMQQNDLSAEHPEVVKDLQQRYEAWWKSVQGTLAINEGLSTPKKGDFHLQKLQEAQLKKGAPPEWTPKEF